MKTKFYVTALIVIASIALHAQEENINRPSVGLLTLGAGVGYFGRNDIFKCLLYC